MHIIIHVSVCLFGVFLLQTTHTHTHTLTHTHKSDGNRDPYSLYVWLVYCRPSLAICVLLPALFYVQNRLQLYSGNRKHESYDTYYLYCLVSLAVTVETWDNVNQVCGIFDFRKYPLEIESVTSLYEKKKRPDQSQIEKNTWGAQLALRNGREVSVICI